MKAFVKGDIDGVFALSLDNLLMLILMRGLCSGVLGFSDELFFGQILPATAVGLLIGNLFYARQALQLAKKENRTDVCALPYGVNLLTVYVHVFLVMLPAKLIALENGATPAEAEQIAWQAGIIACMGSGLIEFFGAFVVNALRRVTPRAALLAALGGIGLAFIGMDFVFRTYYYPLIGLTTLTITLLVYFGGMRFRMGLPAGLVILGVGCAIAWAQGVAPVGELRAGVAGFYPPIPDLGAVASSFQYFVQFLPVILPMGIINLVLSLQNIESAEAAGDKYEARPALLFNGLGSLATATFGSPFPTTIYIGHPGWKKIGAQAGYSTANAIIMGAICLTGTLSIVTWAVPIEAGMAILIWIGVMMCSQAFSATPREHTPAVVLGLIPALGAFAAMAMRNAFAAGGFGSPDQPYGPHMLDVIRETRGYFAEGVFALDQGYIYTCMILAAATVAIIERKFRVAAVWFLVAAFLSFIGFIHTYRFVQGDIIADLFPFGKWLLGPESAEVPWGELKYVWGYLAAASILFVSKWVTEPNPADEAQRASPDSVQQNPPQTGGAP